MPHDLIKKIREARRHVEAGEIEAAKELIRIILTSVDQQVSANTSPQWPRHVLQFVRLRLLKAGRAVLTSDFVLATTALNEAIRALEKPDEKTY